MQNVLSASLLSKNKKIEIHRTIILPVLYGCETWSLTLRQWRTQEFCLVGGSTNSVEDRENGDL